MVKNNWKYPDIKVPKTFLEITDEMLFAWEKDNKICEEYNESLRLQLSELKDKMIIDATYIWGERSNVVKYLSKQQIHVPQLTYFDSIKKGVLKAREEQKQKLLNIESQKELVELQGKAIKYLTEKGKIINVDFKVDDVINIANCIAFEEAIVNEQKKLTESQSYINFNGSDYCENCKGWDGVSRRCQCGNRRVGWVSFGNIDFFLNPYIYGEAW